MSTQKVVDGMITGTVSSSKLTGVLPALDGSALTGIVGITKSSSDPTLTTNPATGTGTIWLNTVSGEMWCCTDATTDANVWTNVGLGTGGVQPIAYQGTTYGYAAGGAGPDPQGAYSKVINKFSFTSATADATDGGDLQANRGAGSGGSSATHGYVLAGWSPNPSPGYTAHTGIEKWAFANDNGAASITGVVTVAVQYTSNGNTSASHIYKTGGYNNSGTNTNIIDRLDTATDGNMTDVGDLTNSTSRQSSSTSTTHGFSAGGLPFTNVINKFSFAATSTVTDHGDLTYNPYGSAGNSSTTHGYTSGGQDTGDVTRLYVNRYSFSSNTTASAMTATLAAGAVDNAATSDSGTHGYQAACKSNNVITRFAFATDSDSTDVGDLTNSVYAPMGTQF